MEGFGSVILFFVINEFHNRNAVLDMSDLLSGGGGERCLLVGFFHQIHRGFLDGGIAVGNGTVIGFGKGLLVAVSRKAAVDNASADKHGGKHSDKH